MKCQLLQGDCREVMKALKDGSVDAVVCDPPYNLAFMGREWDTLGSGYQEWCRQWAAECLRVLKPGGHLLAFGGTRTYHRLACGIEDAGFEIRDSLHWITGAGFPKSLDVSKAIDRAAGAEREVIGEGQCANRGRRTDNSVYAQSTVSSQEQVTAPATEDAARWQGWGTALKPAHEIVIVARKAPAQSAISDIPQNCRDEGAEFSHEPVVLARKPLSGNVAQNVLEHGTGALNIDGCRVETTDRWVATGARSAPGVSYQGSADGSLNVSVSSTHEKGRWPPNVLLTHSADCEPIGTRQVRTGTHVDRNRDASQIGNKIYNERRKDARDGGYADADGRETMEAWSCADDCPVAELDRQSGVISDAHGMTQHGSGTNSVYGRFDRTEKSTGNGGTKDCGGASRFFPVFKYAAKAPRSERPAVDGVEAHATVKPLALMRWLVRLVTPPGGLVLDPFAGTGTTGEACLEEGFRCILIERDEGYVQLARKRLLSRQPTLWDDL